MKLKLKEICEYFSRDFTASETSKILNLSRPTVNYYYKIFREPIINDLFILKGNTFQVEYIKFRNEYFFYIINKNSIHLIEEHSKLLANLKIFIKNEIKKSLINNSKSNAIRILYNKHTQNFTVVGFYTSTLGLQEFINNRLKKFRGIKKENIYSHIKESIFRFNFSNNEINEKILKSLSIKQGL
ncbi:hypothetical protein ACN4FT_02105 [Aliarcobacter butzleri]|uniref:hypothetical protein n=1 Tax=Aliarcobacter butzleri TaxID=28197 RepID=UPI0021B37294|nr:hypothetical protein [Aliarcobacter butzleri]MCT7618123.1 hypothetical protein [Aliarcobacter butzleri]